MNLKPLGLIALALSTPALADGLRVASWNITNYSGGRVSEFQTAIYAQFEGRSMSPDVIAIQEMISQAGVNAFLSILNTAPGSPGDWAAAPFINGNDTDNAFFYRTTRVDFLGVTVVALGASPPEQPRDTDRYDFRPIGYDADAATVAFYSCHMKSGSASADGQRRLLEAQRIRDDAETLPEGWAFMVGGDYNIPSSSQAAYVELVGVQANNDGRFYDPIATPGSWQNNGTCRFVHTQDPTGAGGMDDRYDQILVSANLGDGEGLDYLGAFGVPYSNTTWNDPNHSYRSWGNDGTSFNLGLTVNGNTMVGPDIALALVLSTGGQGGHLPVFLDLVVPPRAQATASLDFGAVPVGATVSLPITVANAGDVGAWGVTGIDDLDYQLIASPAIDAPVGAFALDAGQSAEHTISVTSATPGLVEGVVIVSSDDPVNPEIEIPVTAFFTSGCSVADLAEPFGALDFSDVVAFLTAFAAMQPAADLAAPLGVYDFSDVVAFLTAFAGGCP
ncbi:MAG: GC-type dockerin domain-anchored protein [Phycisphaerales bacterium]